MLDERIAELTTSSLSDTHAYRSVCTAAARDPAVFANFRHMASYTRVLEHVSREQGQGYLDEIRRLDSTLLDDPSWFLANDIYGNPQRFEYESVGLVSPTTLRYVKVAAELSVLFGNLNDHHIVEVGGGYGGQARIIRALFPHSKYTIVDLDEALQLARVYLGKFDQGGLAYVRAPGGVLRADLLLSNYALTECATAVAHRYLKQFVLSHMTPRGYITGNAQERLLFDRLAPLAPRRLFEVPLTSPGNFLCVWGR